MRVASRRGLQSGRRWRCLARALQAVRWLRTAYTRTTHRHWHWPVAQGAGGDSAAGGGGAKQGAMQGGGSIASWAWGVAPAEGV